MVEVSGNARNLGAACNTLTGKGWTLLRNSSLNGQKATNATSLGDMTFKHSSVGPTRSVIVEQRWDVR